jgi:dihydrofolate reductase
MVSLDGFIDADPSYEGPNWASSAEELQEHFLEAEQSIDLHIYGRRVYEFVAAWWPVVAEDPSVPPVTAKYGRLWIQKPKIVVSNTLSAAGWNTQIIGGDTAVEIARLKAEPGGDVMIYGGVLASSLLPYGLIDEFRFYVNPAVLGRGTPMLRTDDVLHLRFLDSLPFGCGVVLLRYEPMVPADQ